ncbi:L-lactate dehydrogenase [Clostridioides difficile]|uniref:L-lactate dehydrogenase n=1 Tax=Clostridioides difficile TaxID=1496 RepID=UPI00117B26D7|nr:L-lactate dehydrogenase [Clostridioides difficile]HAT4772166.1 L-lactate dehydrogenase [Clostridioides difficile]HAT4774392.1 L-lactate dehydrogenase [Clostridioides difficile]HAT4801558.1 L-lactate dehydrogenase [Clostridioides difficile]HAT4832834.1 L-lactate dehydrogenase [Clostridioides difficile]HAT4855290.1 L-lactate dehydrogenase [Clostridioides difficile]
MAIKPRKISIVGSGHVGSHCGFSLITQGVCDELFMIDIDESKSKAQALDLADAVSYLPHKVHIEKGTFSDCKDSDIVVISVADSSEGPLRRQNTTRLDLLRPTIGMIKSIVKPIVDSGFPKNKVIGTGTALDSTRLRRILSEETGIAQQSIQAYSMGEHGDSQMVPWSHVSIGGKPILDMIKDNPNTYSNLDLPSIVEKNKKTGISIINGKDCTEFGIGTALVEIVKAILHNEKKVLPVSTLLEGQYNERNVFAGVPCVIGKDGIEEIIEINMTEYEQNEFNKSCSVLRECIALSKTL